MRTIISILAIVVIGLTLGATSAWYLIRNNHGIGGIESGPWTAWPFAGGSEADPYTMAKVAREGTIPLGATEGLAFEANSDSQDLPLDLSCEYRIFGLTPPAKLWTLALYQPGGDLVRSRDGGIAAIHSGELVRFADSSFRIHISATPRSGNWLSVGGSGRFYIVLRVYDTPVSSSSRSVAPRMPGIVQEGCAS